MTSTSEDTAVSKNNIEGENANPLPLLSSIQEVEQMDDQELNFSENEEDDENQDHLGVGLDDTLASGRCSSTLPPPIAERNSIRGGNVNNSANLTAALHAINNHQSAITAGPAWSNRPPISVDTQKPATELESSIDELMNTLECPICLDTADKPPIFQCPEGHLICESCSQHLDACPQCGHALMNSRNRTAEELASKLQMLRSRCNDSQNISQPSQNISIVVSDPQRTRQGLSMIISYTINTVVRQDRRYISGPNDEDNIKEYTVTRNHSNVTALYNCLIREYRKSGVIVPPPPKGLSKVTAASTVAVHSSESLPSSPAMVMDRRCLALARYLNRLGRHLTIRKDPNFRAFIQEKDIPKALKQPPSKLKDKWASAMERFSIFKAKLTVKEMDPWFKTKSVQLVETSKTLTEMRKTLRALSNLKSEMYSTSADFKRYLALLLVSRPSKERDLGQVVNQAIDCHKLMDAIHQDQSVADELLIELSKDYTLLMDSAQDVLARRRNLQQVFEKKTKKKNKKSKKSSSRTTTTVSEEEEDEDEEEDSEDISEEKAIEELTLKFETMSQTVRRELEHLDFILKEEFEQAFTSYNTYYFNSINKSREATGSRELALRDAVVDQAFSAYHSKKQSADLTNNPDFNYSPNGEPGERMRKITTISNVGHINVVDE